MRSYLSILIPLLLILAACKRAPETPQKAQSSDFSTAEKFFNHQNDSAFYYYNKSTNSSKDSLEIAQSYINMGIIQADGGDFYGAQESILKGLSFLVVEKKEETNKIASAYNELAATSTRLQNYEMAATYYDKALQFIEKKTSRLILLNNKALVFQKQKKYQEAINIFKKTLEQVEKESLDYARILSNMAKTEWLMDSSKRVSTNMLKALAIRLEKNDKWGQNASYAHLTDYYAKKNIDSAIFYATKRLNIAKILSSPDDEIGALRALIKLSPSAITPAHYNRYITLSDSLQAARNNAKNQFALIRYDAEKNKVENLRLQKENIKKNAEIQRQKIILIAIFIIIIIGGISVRHWYVKRKQILMLNAERKIHASKLKTSQKVHDVVANGLYRIMAETEQQEEIDKLRLLDSIEMLYEKSRDISYDEVQELDVPTNKVIADLLTSFSSENTKILIVGNNPKIWENVQPEQFLQVEHILQELMVNMSKHSQANSVAVRFELLKNAINIHYKDNGIGMPVEIKYGNGLKNTENRINQLKGFLSFDTTEKKGLKLLISFPIE